MPQVSTSCAGFTASSRTIALRIASNTRRKNQATERQPKVKGVTIFNHQEHIPANRIKPGSIGPAASYNEVKVDSNGLVSFTAPFSNPFNTAIPNPQGGRFLEIGCGAGVTAVWAALHGCAHVTATDITETAVESTALNVKRHGVEQKVHVQRSE